MKNTVMFSRKQGAWQVLLMSHNKSRRQVKEERRSLVTHLPWDRGQVSDERLPVVTGLTCTENSFPQGNWLILRHNSTQSITVCKAQLGSHVRGCVRWGPPALITFLIVLLSLNLQDFFFLWQVIGQTILTAPAWKWYGTQVERIRVSMPEWPGFKSWPITYQPWDFDKITVLLWDPLSPSKNSLSELMGTLSVLKCLRTQNSSWHLVCN